MIPGASAASVGDAETMARIVANVRANEALYRNREVTAQLEYKGEESKSYALPRLIESSSGSYRVVLQGDYIFIKVDEPFVTKDGQTNCGDTLTLLAEHHQEIRLALIQLRGLSRPTY
jgi:hypothetical protein